MTQNARLCGIAIASTLALTTASALAQSSSTPTPAAPAAAQAAPMPNPLGMEDVSQLTGIAVYGSDDKKIGSVSAVLMNPKTKMLDRLVVREGGVLGIGSHDVAVPINAFKWDSEQRDFTIAQTADELKAMPEWQRPEVAEAPSDAVAPGAMPVAPIAPGSSAQ